MFNKEKELKGLSDFNYSMYQRLDNKELFLVDIFATRNGKYDFFSYCKRMLTDLYNMKYTDNIKNCIDNSIQDIIDKEYDKIEDIKKEYNKKRNKNRFDDNNFTDDIARIQEDIIIMKDIRTVTNYTILNNIVI